ncbi:hypothetical protein Pmani_002872 [Petrolisthes manimaculis]|uniref:Uncharacterized protein n=1 Tax=Petrolisthes manimaculis TaxID=1843537 RepID=A0AAE1QHV2_9EUCA|nr:hypothetical protein Pmani_002872 [Petrolisthes manimaculis]
MGLSCSSRQTHRQTCQQITELHHPTRHHSPKLWPRDLHLMSSCCVSPQDASDSLPPLSPNVAPAPYSTHHIPAPTPPGPLHVPPPSAPTCMSHLLHYHISAPTLPAPLTLPLQLP